MAFYVGPMTDTGIRLVPLSNETRQEYGHEMHIRVLGPIEVLDAGGTDIRLGGPKQRTTLALLVAEVGKVVSVDALIDGLWGAEATHGARSTLQTYVSNRRALLGEVFVRARGVPGLDDAPTLIDSVQFEQAVASAKGLTERDAAEAAQELRAVLALWRGHPYADVSGSFRLELEARRLEELRLVALETRITAELEMGHHSDLVPELDVLCTEFPFNEDFRTQHMLALYRSGRHAEALAAFQKTRTYLVEELGLDASAQLRDLERRILNHDASLLLEAAPQVDTLAFLLTDVEDSTVLWELQTEAMRVAMERHDRIVRAAVETAGGRIVKRVGDGVDSAFADVGAAVAAAEEIQRQLAAEDGLPSERLVVRMAVDVGEVEGRGGDYFGPVLNRAGRMLAASHGGQILLSGDAHAALAASESGWQAKALGEYRFKGIGSPVTVFQLLVDGLPSDFPPLRIDRLPPPISSFGRSVRGYELREEVGSGDFGIVYRAYQPSVGREVAIKIVRADFVNRPSFVRSFEAEARLIAQLEHPHIVSLYDYWRDPEGAYLVMRWLRGGSLRSALERGSWRLEPAARLLVQVGGALSYAHRQGVIHGDVKPANVLLDEEGHAYLADFGNAARLLNAAEAESVVTSSPAYLSPEELEGGSRTARSDIYSLGLLTYELLTGRTPPMDGALPSVKGVRPELPEEIDAVISKATAADPDWRYLSVDAFLAAFGLASGAASELDETMYTATENPYKGLQAFGESDAGDFFGRESVVAELVAAVAEHHFVAVVGPSGIGKSSVVKAGLVPALRRGALGGSAWAITDMFPGSYPFEELAAALLRVAVTRPDGLVEELAHDELGMRRMAKQILPTNTELLLVIDQFEELFTLAADDDARRRFLDGLTQLATDSRSRVRVVVTIRADFLDQPLRYPELGELVKTGMVAVTTPSDDDLAAAIQGPAERVGVRFEPGLVTRIIGDVRDQPGGLPLLQYALTELFAARTTDVLTADGYLATGGVVGALGRRAEGLWEQLGEAGQTIARHVFLRLVTVDAGTQDTRRRVSRRELRHLELDTSALDEILQRYGEHRLLTFDRDPVTRSPTVEVAHEALLAQWERLRVWIDERREDLVLHRRLVEAVSEWEESERGADYLPRAGRLAQFESWALSTDLALSTDERSFLERGRRDEDERQARNAKRRTAIMAGFAFAAAIAIVLAALAVVGRQDAKSSARLASSRELAASAIGALDRDPELSLLLAVKAAETAHPTFESVSAILQAIIQDNTTWTHALPPDATEGGSYGSLSPDGRLLLTGRPDGLEIWNVDRRKQLWKIQFANAQVPSARFSSDGSRVIGTVSWDTTASARPPAGVRPGIHVWEVTTGRALMYRQLGRCPGLTISQYGPFLDLSRPVLLSADVGEHTKDGIGCDSGTFELFRLNIETGKRDRVAVVHRFGPPTATMSADARYVAFADSEKVRVVDTARGYEIFSKPDRSDEKLVLTADGSRLIEGGGYGVPLTLWDVGDKRALRQIDNRVVTSLALGRNDKTLVAIGFDGVIRLWDVASGREVLTLRGHTAGGRWVSLSKDGTKLASFTSDGSLRLWDLTNRAEVGTFTTRTGFYPSESLDVAGGRGAVPIGNANSYGDTLIFNPSTGAILRTIPNVTGQVVRLSPDGRRLAAQQVFGPTSRRGPVFGPIRVHNLQTGTITKMRGTCVSTLSADTECKEPPATPFMEWDWTMDFSPDGTLLAVSDEAAPALSVWDSRTGELLMNRKVAGFSPSLAFSPDGSRLVAATSDGLVVYATHAWKVIARAPSEEGWLRMIRFTPDGKYLVGGSATGKVVVFDTATWKQTSSLVGHEGVIKDLEISPDGTKIASSDAFGLVRIWDLKTGEPLQAIPIGETQVQNVEFLDDRHLLVTPFEGPDMYVMTIDVDELLRIARSRLTRPLTEEECQTYLHVDVCPAS